MTPFNLNHFWITQSELCLKGTFAKASFMFVTIFLNIEMKNNNFYFRTSLWYLKKVSSFRSSKKKCENKMFMSFFQVISDLDDKD